MAVWDLPDGGANCCENAEECLGTCGPRLCCQPEVCPSKETPRETSVKISRTMCAQTSPQRFIVRFNGMFSYEASSVGEMGSHTLFLCNFNDVTEQSQMAWSCPCSKFLASYNEPGFGTEPGHKGNHYLQLYS